jgi:hypothetical protein
VKLREVKLLAAGIVIISLVTTNFIVPAILDDTPALRVTAISKPEPIKAADVPEPVRVLSPAEAIARAAAIRAHADRVLAENGELPGQAETEASAGGATGMLKCVAGCD